MASFYSNIALLHGLLGIGAFGSFWTAALTMKGSPVHRRAGRIYLVIMTGLMLSATWLAAVIAQRGRIVLASFLAYLVLITATSMALGWRAVRRPRDRAAYYGRSFRVLAVVNLLVSVGVLVLGLRVSNVLLSGFSIAGLLVGTRMLQGARRTAAAESRPWWLEEHYVAMLGCGVATHIAFLAIGAPRIAAALGVQLPGWYSLLAWFAPLALAQLAVLALRRRYASPRIAALALPSSASG